MLDKVKSTSEPSRHEWLVEIGPVVWVIAALWLKGSYFGFSIQRTRLQEPISQWLLAHLAMFSGTLASALILLALTPLLPRIWRFLILLLVNTFITTIILSDTISIRFYGDVFSVLNLSTPSMMRDVVTSIVQKLHILDALYYVDIIVGVIVWPFYVRLCHNILPINRHYLKRMSLGLFIGGFLLALPVVRIVWSNKDGILAYSNLQRQVCAVLGVIPYHVGDVVNRLYAREAQVGELERQHVRSFLEEQRQHAALASRLFGIAQDLNVILISAESLHDFPIGLAVNGMPVAPRLSAFARESLYFVNFYEQTHLGTTSDAAFMSLHSLHPLPVGFVVYTYQDNHYQGLPALLAHNGYTTLSAWGATGDIWNVHYLHPRYGFQHSFFEDSYTSAERIGPWLADKDFFRQTVPLLQSQRNPFMAFLLSSTNHHPYELPDKYRVLKLGSLEGTLLGNYLHTVHYFDQAFGEFLDNLRDSGLLDKSMIVLYGDHQGFLGEGRELAQLLGFSAQSEYHYFLNRKKVPFIIRLPGGEQAQILSTAGGHLDIAPTLLSLLGIKPDNSVMLGKDLTREKESLVVFRDGSFVDNKHCYINRFGPASASSCYDVEIGQKIDCRILEEKRRQALQRLEVSDLILRGNLVPSRAHRGEVPLF